MNDCITKLLYAFSLPAYKAISQGHFPLTSQCLNPQKHHVFVTFDIKDFDYFDYLHRNIKRQC